MAEVTDSEREPENCSAVKGPHSLGARIRALKAPLIDSKLGALGAEADQLQQRAEDAEARAAAFERVPDQWWVVQAPDGSTRCEGSDESEARARMRPGDTLLRRWVADVPAEYRVIADASPRAHGDGQTFAHG